MINVMDWARPAVYKERPKRAVMVIVTCFLSFLAVVGYVVGNEYYREDFAGWIRRVRREA